MRILTEPQSDTSQGDPAIVESPTTTVDLGATESVGTSMRRASTRIETRVGTPVSEHEKEDPDPDQAFSGSESWMTQFPELVKDPRDNNPGTPWRDLIDRLKNLDEDHIRSQMGKIDTLNVIAALMLTIILSYIIQAFQPSQPDPINQVAALLYQISRQLDSLKINSDFINSTVGSLDPDNIPSLNLQGPKHNNFLDEASSCSVFIFIVVPLVGLMAQTWCSEYLKQPFINDRYCRVIHFGFFHSRHISTVAKILHGFLRISLVTVVILFWITLQTEANTVNINSGPVIIVAVIMLPTLILSRLLTPRDAIIQGPVTLDDSQFNDEQVLWEIHKWFDPLGPSIPIEIIIGLIRKRLHSRLDPLDLHKTGIRFTETSAIRRSLAISIYMSFFRISTTKNPCFEAKESRHVLAAFKLLCAPRNFETWDIHIREEIVLFLQAYLVTPQPTEALARYLAWISCVKDWRAIIPPHITGKQLLAIITGAQHIVDHEPKSPNTHLAANRSVLYQLVILCAIRTSQSDHGSLFENEFREFMETLPSSLEASQDPQSVSDLVSVRNWHITLHLAIILDRRMPGIIEELDDHSWRLFQSGVRIGNLRRYTQDPPKDGAETPDTDDIERKSYFKGGDYGKAIASLRDAGPPIVEARWDFMQLRNSHFHRLVFLLLHASPDRSTTGSQTWDDCKWRREWELAFGEAQDLVDWEYVHDISRINLHHQAGSGNAAVVRRLQPRIMHTAYTGHSINYIHRGVNTFSPEGRLFQVEYAIEAIKLGSTTVGVCTPEGAVLAVEKRVQSPLLESASIEKIMEIDTHLGCAMSGLIADARTMIDHARVTSQNHAFTYDERIKVESVTQAVCDLALRFGESVHDEDAMMSRPFGVALLIAGVDEKGPQLFHTDPSGTFVRYDAKAVGSGSEAAQSELQDKWHKQMTLKEAHILTLRVLKQVMEEKLDHHNVQLAQVTPNKGFEILDEIRLKELIDDM